MNDYFRILTTVLYWIVYPINYLLHLLLIVALAVFSPVIHLFHYIAFACWYPFSFLPNFETLYIFVGVAVVVGSVTGLSVYFASNLINSFMGLDHTPKEPGGRTLKSYPAEELEKRDEKDPLDKLVHESSEMQSDIPPLKDEMLDWVKREQVRGRNNSMVPNTILEEDDSSEVGL